MVYKHWQHFPDDLLDTTNYMNKAQVFVRYNKIYSVPLRKRPLEDPPTLTLIQGLEAFPLVNKMLILLLLRYIFHTFPEALGKLKQICLNKVQKVEQYKSSKCIEYNNSAKLS